jgi:hypothetical protein
MRIRCSRRSEQPEDGTSGKNVIGFHVWERSNAPIGDPMHHQGEWHIAGNDTCTFLPATRSETGQTRPKWSPPLLPYS